MKVVKNTIAVIVLLLFVAFVCNEFFKYKNKKDIVLMAMESAVESQTTSMIEEVQPVTVETTEELIIDEQEEFDFFNIKEKDVYYDTKIASLDILKQLLGRKYTIIGLSSEKKSALINMLDVIVRHKTKKWRDPAKDVEYLHTLKEKLNGVRFLGDSQISVMAAYNSRLEINDTFHTFKGKNIMEQTEVIDEDTFRDCDTVIMFNGGNLMHFSDGKSYVSSYIELIDKARSFNDKLDIYITSLCPVSNAALEEDLKSPTPHNFYLAPVLDSALIDEFKNSDKAKYIDTKWIADNYLYGKDGIHFKPEFYMTYIPYVLNYIEYIK